MSVYSMAQVETLTGIKGHTLRVWERRYSFLEPERTDTNIRFYSDAQLRKLLNIGILTRNGHKISKIDKMSEEKINELVFSILLESGEAQADEVQGLIICMLEFDEQGFDQIFRKQVIRKGLLTTITGLIYPFLQQVGILWTTNKTIPAQEHFISNLIRQKLISAIDSLPAPGKDAKKILMFLLDGEDHEIGLLLASFIAKDLGWKVYYLGQNVPTDNVKDVIDSIHPSAMLSMFVIPRPDRINKMIEQVSRDQDIPFIISGNPVNMEVVEDSKQLTKLSSPKHLIELLQELK